MKKIKKTISLALSLAMTLSLIPALGGVPTLAAPDDLTRAAVYTYAQGNIARDPAIVAAGFQPLASGGAANVGIYANYTNEQYNSARATSLPRLFDGALAGSSTNQGLAMNTWGSTASSVEGGWPVWISLTWPEAQTIDSTRVMWWTDNNSGTINNSSTGYGMNGKARLQYWTGTAWANVPNTTDPRTGNIVTAFPHAFGTYDVQGNLASSTYNTAWNILTFPPITTTRLRIVLGSHQATFNAAGNQCGISEWEVFASSNPLLSAMTWAKNQIGSLSSLVSNAALPTAYPPDNSITFSYVSSNPAAFGHDGQVTRPAIGQPDAAGTLAITATQGANSATDSVNWSVKALLSDQQIIDLDLAWLSLGNVSNVISNLNLPLVGPNGSAITWGSSNTDNLWDDGTVLRPPSGNAASATLTARLTHGAASGSKQFPVTIAPYSPGGRTIVNVKWSADGAGLPDQVIKVPVGSAPKLPYRVWVEYSDGYGEWRNTKWPWQAGSTTGTSPNGVVNGPAAVAGVWTPSNVETTWKGYPVGRDYTVRGWIVGTGSDSLGFPITVNCTVVPIASWEAENIPDSNPLADPLPPGSVVLTGDNRLTSNAKRSIARTVGYSTDTYLWNYRNHFGYQSPSGGETGPALNAIASGSNPRGSQPTGWENQDTRLRGHGVGHYLSSLALAYSSGLATPAQKATLRNNMIIMVSEMRKLQELTFVQVPASHPNSVENGGTGYLESSNTWPYNDADRAANAPTWPSYMPNLNGVTSAPPAQFNRQVDGHREPQWFGYGYLNAIPPLHPAMNEAYRGYSAWLWAPYYGWHKQLAGLMEIYYVFKDSTDPVEREAGYKALLICADMSRWISERLTVKGTIRDDITRPTRNNYFGTTYGHMAYTWSVNISGEYGGANESIARCAQAVAAEAAAGNPVFAGFANEFMSYPKIASNPGNEAINKVDHDGDGLFSYQDLLISGSEMFRNSSYWNPLIVNSEIMSLNSNSHANSRIPNFPGVLWSYRGNHDPDFYKMALNHFDFNIGRYRYYNGGVGTGEWYRQPYTQIARIPSDSGTGAETCCAYNLARLAKDLACFDPDNPEFADFYERIQYNQLIGSLAQTGWSNTYMFFLGHGSNADYTRGGTPGQSCCGGTSSENHARYTDASYLVSNRGKETIWVNSYMPTTVTWAAAGVQITQECKWPSEYSKFTFATLAGQAAKAFDMKLRVPWWATRGFDIKVDGVSVAASYAPSSFVTLADVPITAVIEVFMPFVESIDYAPDKLDNLWVGAVYYGPLTMASVATSLFAQSAWTTLEINSDLSNISKNGPSDNIANGSAALAGANSNLYTMTIPGNSYTSGSNELRPSYYRTSVSTNPRPVHYFKINILGEGTIDKTALFVMINEGRSYLGSGASEGSLAALAAAIMSGVAAYQSDTLTLLQMNARIDEIQAAIDGLEGITLDKGALQALVDEALARKADQEAWLLDNDDRPIYPDHPEAPDDKPWARYGYSRMIAALPAAQAELVSESSTVASVNAAIESLGAAMDMRIGNQYEIEDLADSGLNDLMAQAEAINPLLYTVESYAVLAQAVLEGEGESTAITSGSSTMGRLPTVLVNLRGALAGLEPIGGPILAPGENLALKITYTGTSTDARGAGMTFTNGSMSTNLSQANTWNRISALNNGLATRSNVANSEAWGSWGHSPAPSATAPLWLEYDFGARYDIGSTKIYWNDNHVARDASGAVGDGGIKTPANGAWRLEYWNYGLATPAWSSVALLDGFSYNAAAAIDQFNELKFETINSDRVRLVFTGRNANNGSNGQGSAGIVEWEVWSVDAVAFTELTISFEANGGTGSMPPVSIYENESRTLPANGFLRSNHIFTHWNTAANNSGTSYAAGGTIDGLTSDITLYAQWTRNTSALGPGPIIIPSW